MPGPLPLSHSSLRCALRACALSMLALVMHAHAGEAREYALDPVHTRVMFAVEHAGFSRAIGTVSGSTGTLVFDEDDWSSASLDATVPLLRLDLGDAKWNEATLAGSLLDAKAHPVAHFRSTRIEATDATHAAVYGMLTLHGVTREVKLDVVVNAVKRHPMPPFRRTAGFSATTRISRADFGITSWKSVIGDDVELRIEAEATYRGKADADDADPDSDSDSSQPPQDATP